MNYLIHFEKQIKSSRPIVLKNQKSKNILSAAKSGGNTQKVLRQEQILWSTGWMMEL